MNQARLSPLESRNAPRRVNLVRPATREDLPRLEELVRTHSGPRSLLHRPFVERYYFNNPFCRLCISVGAADQICAVMGTEQLPFEHQGRRMQFGCASNWFAFRKGHGLRLYHQGGVEYRYGIVFGGSDDTHAILKRIGWRFFDVPMVYFNRPHVARTGDNLLRRFAKGALNRLERRLPSPTGACIEIGQYSDTILPRTMPFAFRLDATVEYLRWRYALDLPFARYRLFRLLRTRGYVILQECPDYVMVAQCDGEDPVLLAHGVVDALSMILSGRYAGLSCSHPAMLKVFRDYGFRIGETRTLALGAVAGNLPDDPARWLVNFDWGDNGLRAPFPEWPVNPAPVTPDRQPASVRTRWTWAA